MCSNRLIFQVDILQLQPMETATQLMVEDFTTFRLIGNS